MTLSVTARGVGSTNTGGQSTLVITPASNCTAHTLLTLWVAYDNSQTSPAGGDPYSGIVDSNGNTWTARVTQLNDPGAANAGVVLRGFTTAQDAGALTTGDTITVSFGGITTVARGWVLREWVSSIGTAHYIASGGTTGTGTGPTVTTSSIPSGNGVDAAMGAEGNAAITADSDTTRGSWSAQQTSGVGTTTAGVEIASQAKIVSAVGTQTYNVTITSADWCIAWMQIGSTEFTQVGAKTNGSFNTALYGTNEGAIWKTPDFCATLDLKYTISGSPQITCIAPDTELDNYWWVGTADGRVYKTTDDGENWVEHVDFEDGFPIYAILTPTGTTDLWVFGGDTGTPTSLVRVDFGKTGTFESIALSGDLGGAIDLAGDGFAIRRAVDHGAGGLLGIGFTGGVDPPFWVARDPLGVPDGWTAPTGQVATEVVALAGGSAGGEFVLVGTGTTVYYTADGAAMSAIGTSDVQLNDVVWERVIGIYVAAGDDGILKSIDFGATWGYMRPSVLFDATWPDGAFGYAVAYEVSARIPEPPPTDLGPLYATINETDVDHEPAHGNLLNLANLDTVDEEWVLISRLLALHGATAGLLGYARYLTAGNFVQEVIGGANTYSHDYGTTWATATLPDGISWVRSFSLAGTGGRLWGIGYVTAVGTLSAILYSDDYGETWTVSDFVSDDNLSLSSLDCHPTDSEKIAAAQWSDATGTPETSMYVWYTLDGGDTWTKVQTTELPQSLYKEPLVAWLGNRIVVTTYGGYAGAQALGDQDNLIAWADFPYAHGDWTMAPLPDNDAQIPGWDRLANFGGKLWLLDYANGGGSQLTSARLYVTVDAETWLAVETPAEADRVYDYTYDADFGTVYIIGRNDAANEDRVWGLLNADTVDPSAVVSADWVDHTANLITDWRADTIANRASIMVVVDAPGVLYLIARTPTPQVYLVRLLGTAWEIRSSISEPQPRGLHFLRRRTRLGYMGDFSDATGQDRIGKYSDDLGATWISPTPPAAAGTWDAMSLPVAAATGGKLFALWEDHARASGNGLGLYEALAESTDDGATWTVIYQPTSGGLIRLLTAIAAHRTDPLKLAVIYKEGTTVTKVAYSTDGGSSFTLSASATTAKASSIVYGDSDRIIVAGVPSADVFVKWSDPPYTSWSSVNVGVHTNNTVTRLYYFNGKIYLLLDSVGGTEALWRSEDNGATWTNINTPLNVNNGGLAYDPSLDRLFIYQDSASASLVSSIDGITARTASAVVAGDWVDRSYNLGTLVFPFDMLQGASSIVFTA